MPKIYLQYFLVILKHSLQNYYKILKKCFLVTYIGSWANYYKKILGKSPISNELTLFKRVTIYSVDLSMLQTVLHTQYREKHFFKRFYLATKFSRRVTHHYEVEQLYRYAEVTFLQDFLAIPKRMLRDYYKILKNCFLNTSSRKQVMYN